MFYVRREINVSPQQAARLRGRFVIAYEDPNGALRAWDGMFDDRRTARPPKVFTSMPLVQLERVRKHYNLPDAFIGRLSSN